MSVLFILGAGASQDSGFLTYRGVNGIYASNELCDSPDPDVNPLHVSALQDPDRLESLWQILNPIKQKTTQNPKLGPTYNIIQRIINQTSNECLIVTQNVDGLALSCLTQNCRVIEIHGNIQTTQCLNATCNTISDKNAKYCTICNSIVRPNIVLYGEEINKSLMYDIQRWIKKNAPKYVYVIGTSLQFDYLNQIISTGKKKGASVIHVNPDPKYQGHSHRQKIKKMSECNEPPRIIQIRKKKPDKLITPEEFLKTHIN